MRKYVDVTVSKELLERLEKDKQEAVGQARYGRFKAWLHYANLRRWQEQGWHSGEAGGGAAGLHERIDEPPS